MNLHEYFENTIGIGILATADRNGIVNTAIYARPHFIDEEYCIFLMADKRSHKNIQENPHASYIFIEKSVEYKGKRLYLTKINESEDSVLANKIRRNRNRFQFDKTDQTRKSFVIYFKVDSIRPLIGDTEK